MRYFVTISIKGELCLEVEASSKEEAKEIAEHECCLDDLEDWTPVGYEVEEAE